MSGRGLFPKVFQPLSVTVGHAMLELVTHMLGLIARVALWAALLAALGLLLAVLLTRVMVELTLRRHASGVNSRRTLAFLHPYCNDGGGGERVLWVALREIAARGLAPAPAWRLIVFTGGAASPAQIRQHAFARFGISVSDRVEFVYLSLRPLIEPQYYRVGTLVFQALGSMALLLEALWRAPPELLVDTTGFGFTYALAKFAGVRRIACYMHYPTITSDMIDRVARHAVSHNNAAYISRSPPLSALKLAYYRALRTLYRASGRHADTVLANSRWTAHHLSALWGIPVVIVYPPCDTVALRAHPLALQQRRRRRRLVLSIGQFRPEKDHALQLRAFAQLVREWEAHGAAPPPPQLVLAGAVRHTADAARLKALSALAFALGLEEPTRVCFAPNLSCAELHALYAEASVGLHTMWNEHFGIGIVELMAAGAAPVAHASGGPALDIVGTDARRGLLAETEGQYCQALAALTIEPGADARAMEIALSARNFVARRFSEDAFAAGFCEQIGALLALLEESQ